MDTVSKARRSEIMSRIRSKDTVPEMKVRSLVHRLGCRFRLHRRDLPGTPDLVFPSRKMVVFVHGCFFHRHKDCKNATMPKTRREWWQAKLEGNAARDRRNRAALRRIGWKVVTVWECETEKPERLTRRLARLLSDF